MSTAFLRIGILAGFMLFSGLASAWASEAAHAGEHHVNWVYVISLFFNFIAFITIMVFLLRKPVSRFFADRADEVRARLEAADRAREKAEAKGREYACKIDELVATREEVMTQSRAEAVYEKERILDTARRQAERLQKDAERNIAIEIDKATRQLSAEAARAIAEQAEELLTQAATSDDTVRLADDYIESIREVKRA